MSNLKVVLWRNSEGTGEPEVEVKVPTNLAKWVPVMMRFVPRKTKEEMWGGDVDFAEMFNDVEKIVKEASEKGQSEIMDVRSKDAHMKVLVE